ncbi:hypothetical protein NCLIV_055540 [Neospora caninum Liverpool]|nr:hypothetical protein NCLIV_055540 [Neospora caninum Liverpool]CBZ55129.1 hypothetical protein NCLIV_055540 [Neospora caninum Liverpool]|eukprot:XP_003885157.1 hypothetical protein NCLIV_055540 [Neospora caninum Liverpool]
MFSGIPERPEAVQTLLNAAASSSSTLYDGQEKHRSADVERGGGRTRDEGGSSVATGGGRFSYYAGDVVLKRTVSPDGKSSSEWRPARHEGKGGGKRQFVRGGSNSLHVGPPTSTDSNTFFTPSLYRRMCLKVFVHDGSARLFAVLLLQNLEWPTFTKYRLGTAMFLNNLRRKAASFDEHRDSQYAFLDCCPLHKIAAKGVSLSYLRARVHRHSDLRRIKRELQTSSREFSYSVRHLPAVRKQVSSRTGLFQALLVTWDLFATSILKFKLFKVGGPEALMTHGQKSRYFMDLAEHLLDLWFSERAFFAPLMWAYGSFAPVVNDAPFRRPQQSTSILLMDGMKDYLFGERPHHQMGAGLLYTSRQLDALRWLEGRVKEAVYQKLQKALRRFQGFPVVSSSSAPFYRGHRSHAAGDVPFLDHFPALFRDKRLPTVQVTGYFLRGERGDEVKAGVFGDKIADDRVEELMAGLPAHSALLQLTMVDAWAWNRCTDEGGANGECPEARAGGRAAPSWSPYGVRLQDDSAPLGRYLPVSTASQLLNIELRWDPSLLNAAGRTVVLLNDIVGLDSAGVQGPEADPAMDLDVHAVLLLPVRDFSSAEDVRRDVVRLVSSRTPSRLYAKSAQQSGLLDPSRVKILGTARWVGSNQPRLLLGEFGRGISSRGVQGSLDLLERGSILVHISIAGIARKFRVPEDKSSGQTADDGVGSGAGTAQDGQNAARARTAFLGGAEEAGLGAAAQAGWGMTAKEAYRRLVRRTQGGPARVVYVQTSVEEFPKAKADKKKQRRGGRIPWMAVAISNMCVFFFFLIIFVYLHWRRHVDLPWWLKCVCTSAAPWMEDDDASEAADSDNQRESCDSSCEGSESVDERSYSSTADPDGFSSARERSSSLTSWSLGGCPSRASRYPTAASVPREGGSPFDSYFQSPLSLVPLVTELPSVMGREFSGSAAVPLGCGWPGGAVQSPLYVLYRAQLPHLEWARRERESAHASFPRRGSLGLSLPRGGSGGALPVSRAQESAQTGISRSATDGDTVGNRAETFAGSADRQEALETGSPGPRDACPGTDGEKDGAEAGCDYELVVRFVDSRERRSSWV